MIITSPPPTILKPSGCLFLGQNQNNLPIDVWTDVELNTISSGFTDGIEDTVNHKITPGVAGLFLLIGRISFVEIIGDYEYGCAIELNGGGTLIENWGHSSLEADLNVCCTMIHWLTNTDYIKLQAYNGGNAATVDVKQVSGLSVARLR